MLSTLPPTLPAPDPKLASSRDTRPREPAASGDTGFARLMQQQHQLRQTQQQQLAQRQAALRSPAPQDEDRQVSDADAAAPLADADRAQPDGAADPAGASPGGPSSLHRSDAADDASALPGDAAADAAAPPDPAKPLAATATDGLPDAALAAPWLALAGSRPLPAEPNTAPSPATAARAAMAAEGTAGAVSAGRATAATLTSPAATMAAWQASLAANARAPGAQHAKDALDTPAADGPADDSAALTTGESAAVRPRSAGSLRPQTDATGSDRLMAPNPAPLPAGQPTAREALASAFGRDPATHATEATGAVSGTAAPAAAALLAASPLASGPAAAPGPGAQAQIPVPLDSPLFAPALGAQVSLFARDGVQSAQLQLHPAEMGPISIHIALDGQAARVDFQADLAATRSVIEASLPALAAALQDAGLTLSGGGVSQHASGRQDGGRGAQPAPMRGDGRLAAVDEVLVSSGAPRGPQRRGLVDLVA